MLYYSTVKVILRKKRGEKQRQTERREREGEIVLSQNTKQMMILPEYQSQIQVLRGKFLPMAPFEHGSSGQIQAKRCLGKESDTNDN